MGHRVRRPEDDDRATRPSHPPLSYPRNRKRQLPLQEQLGESSQTRKGETSKLDERLTPKPSSSRVSSRWKLRVKSQRKSTYSSMQFKFVAPGRGSASRWRLQVNSGGSRETSRPPIQSPG